MYNAVTCCLVMPRSMTGFLILAIAEILKVSIRMHATVAAVNLFLFIINWFSDKNQCCTQTR